MLDLRPILLVNGTLLATLGGAMAIPALADAGADNPDWLVFAVSALMTLFVGVALALMNWGHTSTLSIKEAFVMVVAAWVLLPAYAAIPFVFSEMELSYTDAYFEAMSGLTTTGATVITGLDDAPPGILLWRSLLQWLGGLGIIVMAIAILPILQIGGMQLFKVEAFDTTEKVLPSAAQMGGALTSFYVVVTFVFVLLLWVAGMPAFDAVNHAMTTIATGGFSTRDASVGHFDSATIDYIISAGMIVGSLPFALYLQALRGSLVPLWRDTQVQTFFAVVIVLVAGLTLYQATHDLNDGLSEQVRFGMFNVISIMTGTGYSTQDYGQWGAFAVTAFFFIMFIGGCAGSTSCGIKIFRFQVVYEAAEVRLKRLVYPNGTFVPRYQGRLLPDAVTASVMSFMFLFFFVFLVIAALLNMMGLDNLTALSAAGSAIANVGPGLGDTVGPSGTYAPLPGAGKWLLSFAMLLGRLEFFTVLVLFTPDFWRR